MKQKIKDLEKWDENKILSWEITLSFWSEIGKSHTYD